MIDPRILRVLFRQSSWHEESRNRIHGDRSGDIPLAPALGPQFVRLLLPSPTDRALAKQYQLRGSPIGEIPPRHNVEIIILGLIQALPITASFSLAQKGDQVRDGVTETRREVLPGRSEYRDRLAVTEIPAGRRRTQFLEQLVDRGSIVVVVGDADGHEELEQICGGRPVTKLKPLLRDFKRICVTRPASPIPVRENFHPLVEKHLEGFDVSPPRLRHFLTRLRVGRDRFILGSGEPELPDHVGPRQVAGRGGRADPLQTVGVVLDRQA
ncbi:hypothetical protein [Candidatus Palauibacter sp.]|uniref:hypothetical protein n=1 Tax=Candidatus Palauibacter sp. TaxID=3101350 RepID=UPI003AF23472